MARTIRVGIDKLDRMLNLTGEIAISRGRVRLMAEELGRPGEAILEALHEIEQLYIDLQEQVMQVRMVPLGPVFSQYARPIRDMARGLGKLARLEIEGANVELDTTVIEQIRDPLTHMVRNSIDHGIEAPDKRRAARKPPCGVLKFCAYHNAGSVVIQLCDDGAGFNRQKILERAIAMGKISQPDKVSDQQLYSFIFEPGFSTADKVTDLSGRGVGMDVVRRNIDLLHGSIEVESQEGIGATITIRLPLTLAIIDGFAVGVGDDSFIIPLDAVLECLDFPAEACSARDQTGVINLRGDVLPYLRLNRFFKYPCLGARRENVVVVQHENFKAGLVVETLQGERQTVIKPLGKLFQGVPGISGSAILGNGKVGLILDVPSLLRDAIAQQQEACAPPLPN